MPTTSVKLLTAAVASEKWYQPVDLVMDFGDRILFIGAHCDDIEIGCGGTAAKLAAMGRSVAFAIAADCGAGRRAEAIEAAAKLGLKEEEATVWFGGLPDRLLYQHQ